MWNAATIDLEAGVAPHLLTIPAPLSAADISEFSSILDGQRHCRSRRFHFERDRHAFVFVHAALRRIQSRYEPVAPESWEFEIGPWGKPEIGGRNRGSLRFSLSHTHGLAAIVVTCLSDVGVDVERIKPIANSLAPAARFCSPSELAHLAAKEPAERLRRIYWLWTLKVAYVEACGTGLAAPVERISFGIEHHSVKASLQALDDDDASLWWVSAFGPTLEHQLAMAVRAPSPALWTIRDTDRRATMTYSAY